MSDDDLACLEALLLSRDTSFEDDIHGRIFARLRRDDPVHHCKAEHFGPYWSITRLDDIVEIERNHSIFSPSGNAAGIEYFPPAFAASDPPIHTRERLAAAPSVSPRRVAMLMEDMRTVIGDILDRLPQNEPFDWAQRVSTEITDHMAAVLFDWSSEQRVLIPAWCEAMALPESDEDSTGERQAAIASFRIHMLQEWEKRAGAPPAFDVVSCLAHEPATQSLYQTPDRLIGTVTLIAVANEAARDALNSGVVALQRYPNLWKELHAKPELLAQMISEVVRWQSPILHMHRTATRDVTFRGKEIRRGDRVVLWYCSANRDETYFPDGEVFRLDRSNARRHAGYGFGAHRCFGRHVAEMELRLLWEEILKRFAYIEVMSPPGASAGRLYVKVQVLAQRREERRVDPELASPATTIEKLRERQGPDGEEAPHGRP